MGLSSRRVKKITFRCAQKLWFLLFAVFSASAWLTAAHADTLAHFFSGPVYVKIENRDSQGSLYYECEGWAQLDLTFERDGQVRAVYHRYTDVASGGSPPRACQITTGWTSDEFIGSHANGTFQVKIFSYLDVSGTFDEYSVSGTGHGVDVDEWLDVVLTESIEPFTLGSPYRLEPFEAELAVGGHVNFVVKKADGSVLDNGDISWSVLRQASISPYVEGNNARIGSVDASGRFTGSGIGSCAVAASLANGARIEAEVKVRCPAGPGNIQALQALYRQRISEGPFHRDLRAGALSRPFRNMNPGYATNLYASTDAEYANYTCGARQGDVLQFLHRVQSDPNECTMLNGFDFGPVQGSYGGHHAVVVYPSAGDWKTEGLVFDPWYHQKPESFPVDVWQQVFSPIAGDTSKDYRLRYPTTQDSADYNTDVWGAAEALVQDALQVTGIVDCPVNVLFTDANGRRSGVDAGGAALFEIPDTFFMRIPDDAGGFEWYFRLSGDIGAYRMEITGTRAGSFNLVTASGQTRKAYAYGQQSIGPGATASGLISGTDPGPVLKLPDASEALPEAQDLPEPCWLVDQNLGIFVPRASVAGKHFAFRLKYSHDLLWELDVSSLAETGTGVGIPVGSDLSLSFACAQFGAARYSFTLRYESGLLWELDLNSLSVK